jgi:hypothetical protein
VTGRSPQTFVGHGWQGSSGESAMLSGLPSSPKFFQVESPNAILPASAACTGWPKKPNTPDAVLRNNCSEETCWWSRMPSGIGHVNFAWTVCPPVPPACCTLHEVRDPSDPCFCPGSAVPRNLTTPFRRIVFDGASHPDICFGSITGHYCTPV